MQVAIMTLIQFNHSGVHNIKLNVNLSQNRGILSIPVNAVSTKNSVFVVNLTFHILFWLLSYACFYHDLAKAQLS